MRSFRNMCYAACVFTGCIVFSHFLYDRYSVHSVRQKQLQQGARAKLQQEDNVARMQGLPSSGNPLGPVPPVADAGDRSIQTLPSTEKSHTAEVDPSEQASPLLSEAEAKDQTTERQHEDSAPARQSLSPDVNGHDHIKLILVGMKRSGSSFTNALLHSHPKVYMVYEAIWYMNDPTVNHSVSDRSRSIRERTKKEWLKHQYIPEPLDYIRSMLNCEINATQLAFLRWVAGSRDMGPAMGCKKRKGTARDDCFNKVIKSCQAKPVRLTKVVRLSMAEAGQLLEADPRVKILYLARDPRGTYNSHEQTQKKAGKPPVKFPKNLKSIKERCLWKTRDVQNAVLLRKTYGERVLVMRYEDIAADPMNVLRKLLNWVGLDMTPEVTARVTKMTNNPSVKERSFQTSRKDSNKTAHNWRSLLGFETAHALQEACTGHFTTLRYNKLDTEAAMRNYQLPDMEPLDTSEVFTL